MQRTRNFARLPLIDDVKVYFEYLILVMFNKDYSLNQIYELPWDQFIKYKKMKPPENKWNLPIFVEYFFYEKTLSDFMRHMLINNS
jgi:hypothetical protein